METVRADKWLWAVRLFKTRSLAARACESGRVKSDGRPLKPSSSLKVGQILEVPFPDGPGTRTVRVAEVIAKRVGAARAAACCEDLTPQEVITSRTEALRARSLRREGGQGRPTKRDRRQMRKPGGFFQ